jgi:hypothetical protein
MGLGVGLTTPPRKNLLLLNLQSLWKRAMEEAKTHTGLYIKKIQPVWGSFVYYAALLATVLAYVCTRASSLDGFQWTGSAKDKYTSVAWVTSLSGIIT